MIEKHGVQVGQASGCRFYHLKSARDRETVYYRFVKQAVDAEAQQLKKKRRAGTGARPVGTRAMAVVHIERCAS
ncbi:hypothetical protein GGTG_11358 [Gaeumannomyces tritici R3-111a-1]|uniref:Uncharacterized protein n=1 Tax=Gaeumannomyces tritici (strain R3-111a-1) TaxID=644352 RepID=J3PCY5_GAET3|nr:hypothetical protein GGTG_11358 [Gaeumannomyces tritici R3-111a-1]EJT70330.1 hypothetical protein GGTG_11358 [Gaeumannomyces tritici R3-111a-1]